MIIIAIVLFLITSFLSCIGLNFLPSKHWKWIDYSAVLLGFIGVILTLSEVNETKRQQKIDRSQIETQSRFQDVMTRTEYLMEECGVWWNIVLDQTNKDPAACNLPHPQFAGKTCKETCRAGHFVMQHRRDVIGTSELNYLAENLRDLVDSTEGPEFASLRRATNAYFISAQKLSAEQRNNPMVNSFILVFAQLLIAFALGLEVGKIYHSVRNK